MKSDIKLVRLINGELQVLYNDIEQVVISPPYKISEIVELIMLGYHILYRSEAGDKIEILLVDGSKLTPIHIETKTGYYL